MIRSNPFAVALITLLFVLSLACAWCAGWWFLGVRELQRLKYRGQYMSQTSTAVQALANEAIEYSRRHPDIEPLLKKFEVVQSRTTPAPTPTPSPTPASPSPAVSQP